MTSCPPPPPSSLTFLKGSSSFHVLRIRLHLQHISVLFAYPTPRYPPINHQRQPPLFPIGQCPTRPSANPLRYSTSFLIFFNTPFHHQSQQNGREPRCPLLVCHSPALFFLPSSTISLYERRRRFPKDQLINVYFASPFLFFINHEI